MATKTSKNTVADRAMLADLSVTFWTAHKKDHEISDETARAKHASEDAGSWWTSLLPPKAQAGILAARTRARATHFEFTLPWHNDGARILPAEMFWAYTQLMREHEKQYREAVEKFLTQYPTFVDTAKVRLGVMFHAEDFPTADVLRTKFYWKVRVSGIPTGADFRVDLGSKDDTDAIKAEIDSQLMDDLRGTLGDLWERLFTVVTNFAEKMKEEKPIFRDSLVENIKDTCHILSKLNILGDENLEQVRKQVMDTLAAMPAEELRDNPEQRKTSAKAADDILAAMSKFRKAD